MNDYSNEYLKLICRWTITGRQICKVLSRTIYGKGNLRKPEGKVGEICFRSLAESTFPC